MTGFTKNYPNYPFQTLDTSRVITIPIRSITAPPGWPAPKDGSTTRTYDWIDKTWPKVSKA
jgi:branched-chain amino acid transport system substrate-binding protein